MFENVANSSTMFETRQIVSLIQQTSTISVYRCINKLIKSEFLIKRSSLLDARQENLFITGLGIRHLSIYSKL